MVRSESLSPDLRSREGDSLAACALGRFLICGSWATTSAELVRVLGSSADTALLTVTLTRAAASWHGARAALERALGEAVGRDRTVALANVLVEARETLGTWELVYALLERHTETPPGRALDPQLIDAALTLARAWCLEDASGDSHVLHAA